MTPEAKQQVQGCFFDLLVAMDPTVGDIVEIAYGLAYMTMMRHFNNDPVEAAAAMRTALDQCLDQASRIARPEMSGIMSGGKLDS